MIDKTKTNLKKIKFIITLYILIFLTCILSISFIGKNMADFESYVLSIDEEQVKLKTVYLEFFETRNGLIVIDSLIIGFIITFFILIKLRVLVIFYFRVILLIFFFLFLIRIILVLVNIEDEYVDAIFKVNDVIGDINNDLLMQYLKSWKTQYNS